MTVQPKSVINLIFKENEQRQRQNDKWKYRLATIAKIIDKEQHYTCNVKRKWDFFVNNDGTSLTTEITLHSLSHRKNLECNKMYLASVLQCTYVDDEMKKATDNLLSVN